MNLEDGVKFVTSQLSRFASISFSVVTNPLSGYMSLRAMKEGGRQQEIQDFWAYVVICIFLGSTVLSFIPGQHKSFIRGEDQFLFTLIVTLWLWFLFSVFAFAVTKMLRGTTGFLQTAHTSLILLATAYATSSLISLTCAVLLKILLRDVYRVEMAHTAFVVVQAVFLLIYLPANLGAINHFEAWKKAVIGLILPISVLITNLALMVWFIESLEIGVNK